MPYWKTFITVGLFLTIISCIKLLGTHFDDDIKVVMISRRVDNSGPQILRSPVYLVGLPKCGTTIFGIIVERVSKECAYTGSNGSFHFSSLHPKSNAVYLDKFPIGLKRNSRLFSGAYAPLIVIRDLRDALISLTGYVDKKLMDHGWTELNKSKKFWGKALKSDNDLLKMRKKWRNATFDKKLFWIIEDGQNSIWRPYHYRFQIDEIVDLLKKYPHTPKFWYEDLAGSDGGGDDSLKHAELDRLTQILGFQNCSRTIDRLTKHSRDIKTHTLHNATIQNWKHLFKASHTKLFKQLYSKYQLTIGNSKLLPNERF